jgi:hypothetical protein
MAARACLRRLFGEHGTLRYTGWVGLTGDGWILPRSGAF